MKISKPILIGVIAFIVGLVGLIICLVPGQSAADATVADYVSAVNSGNTKKMSDCILKPSDLGVNMDFDLDYDTSESTGDKKLDALNESEFDFEDNDSVKKINSVTLVGCIDGKKQTQSYMPGKKAEYVNVTAVVEIKYENDEGDEVVVYDEEEFQLVKGKRGFKIAS